MFPLRYAAARLLTSRSISIAARPRTITTITSAQIRQPRFIAPLQIQRRWATNEAEAKKEEDDAPISQIQPTPQEEVENAIQAEQSTTIGTEAPAIAETANATEATEEATSTSAESQSVQEAVDAPQPLQGARDAAAQLTQGFQSSEGSQRPYREPPTPRSSVYVGNLFFDVTESDLKKAFDSFGTIGDCRLIRDARGLSKGFGYVTFASTEEATAAVNAMNQQLFEGRRLMVSYAYSDGAPKRPGNDRENRPINAPSKTLFIGNMSFDMTDRDLNNLFRGIRNVIDVRVAIDRRTGQPRGFAHADFIDVKSAQDAMKVLAGKEVYGRSLRVDFSYGPSASPRNTPR